MFEEYLGYWHELTPEVRGTIQTAGLAVAAELAGSRRVALGEASALLEM